MEEFNDMGSAWVELKRPDGRLYFYHIPEDRTVNDEPKDYRRYVSQVAAAFLGPSEWQVFHDEAKNKDYFYNKATKKTQWNRPEGFDEYENRKQLMVEQVSRRQQQAMNAIQAEVPFGDWTAYFNDKHGKCYFFNSSTATTTWDPPSVVVERQALLERFVKENPLVSPEECVLEVIQEEQDEAGDTAADREDLKQTEETAAEFQLETTQTQEMEGIDGNGRQDETMAVEMVPEAEAEFAAASAAEQEEIRKQMQLQREQAKQVLEQQLSVNDAIMAVGVKDHIIQYNRLKGDAVTLVRLLGDSYRGYAEMCHLVTGWLHTIEASPEAADEPSNGTTPHPQLQFARDFAAETILRNFEGMKADSLLDKVSGTPDWLIQLMNDPYWRHFLISLSNKHSDSHMLGHCLQELAKMGHHREIAAVLTQAGRFLVYKPVLVDMMARVPHASSSELTELLEDFKRMCCSAEYMFIFAEEVLKRTEAALEDDNEDGKRRKRSLSEITDQMPIQSQSSAKRKYQRLRQELENTTVWGRPKTNTGRLDPVAQFALKLTDLYDGPLLHAHGKFMREIHTLVRREDIDLPNVDGIVRCLEGYTSVVAFADDGEVTIPGELDPVILKVLQHPQVLQHFVDAGFHPTKRFVEPEIARKVCWLLTIACAIHEPNSRAVFEAITSAVAITKAVDDMSFGLAASEQPVQLTSLMDIPVVSMCVMRWIECTVTDSAFAAGSAYASVAPVFLHLLVAATQKHSLQRPVVFRILKVFLTQTNEGSDQIDSAKVMDVRRDAMECLIYLMSSGFVVRVLDFLIETISTFDQTLIRHFLVMVTTEAQAPYSHAFTVKMAKVLATNSVRKAVSSRNFQFEHQKLLHAFIARLDLSLVDATTKKHLDSLQATPTVGFLR